jgi:NADH:ubiquinone oxidoreductase subunit 3 (subunit A)
MKKLMSKVIRFAAVTAMAVGTILVSMTATKVLGQGNNSMPHLQPYIRSAYERGYENGYNDGYRSGMTDYGAMKGRDYECSRLY